MVNLHELEHGQVSGGCGSGSRCGGCRGKRYQAHLHDLQLFQLLAARAIVNQGR